MTTETETYIEPIVKSLLAIQEAIRAQGTSEKPAYGMFFRSLFVYPGITVDNLLKQHHKRKELDGIMSVLLELKQELSKYRGDSRIHYTDIGLSKILEILDIINLKLEEIKNMHIENNMIYADKQVSGSSI